MSHFKIGDRRVGDGAPSLIVAEVGLTHGGDPDLAGRYIVCAAEAGVDAIKFQAHIAEAESTLREPFRVKMTGKDATRFDYWKRTSFDRGQWRSLTDLAMEKELMFLCSPFSVEAVDLLEGLGVPAWKVGSGEVTNTVMLDRMIETGRPILLSSGMSTWTELDQAVERVKRAGVPVMVYQCTTAYPCPPDKVGLGLIREMRERYGVPVGLSDHSGKVYAGIAAVALGAASIEMHLCLSREDTGPDVSASLTPEETGQLVEGIRAVEADLETPVDKDAVSGGLAEMKWMFGKGIVARTALSKGTVLGAEDMMVKKPADGLPPSRMAELVGRKVCRDLEADDPILEKDLK